MPAAELVLQRFEKGERGLRIALAQIASQLNAIPQLLRPYAKSMDIRRVQAVACERQGLAPLRVSLGDGLSQNSGGVLTLTVREFIQKPLGTMRQGEKLAAREP